MQLSVVIPAYNEQDNIKRTIYQVKDALSDMDFEIVAVDDGSTDNTYKILSNIDNVNILKNNENMGKGYSVKKGIGYCKGDVIAVFDADMAYNPKLIADGYKLLESGDVVFGKRFKKGSYPFYRYLSSEVFHLLTEIYLKTGDIDTQCGFKMMKKSAAEKLKKYVTSNNFSYDMQMAYYVKKLGINYVNMQVCVQSHAPSTVKMFKDGFTMLSDIRKISRTGDL